MLPGIKLQKISMWSNLALFNYVEKFLDHNLCAAKDMYIVIGMQLNAIF